jgi:hypothetical protein
MFVVLTRSPRSPPSIYSGRENIPLSIGIALVLNLVYLLKSRGAGESQTTKPNRLSRL